MIDTAIKVSHQFKINHCYRAEKTNKVVCIMTNPERNFPEYSRCLVWPVASVVRKDKLCWVILWHARPAEIFQEKLTEDHSEHLYFEGEYYYACNQEPIGDILTK